MQDSSANSVFSRASLVGAGLFALAAGVLLWARLPAPALAAAIYLCFTMALVTLIDARHFIIPDVISLPSIPLGAVANILVFTPEDWPAGLTESATGAVIAGGAFYLLRAFYFRFRGVEGLGLGDVKLAAVAGAWLGPEPLAMACLFAALGGLVAALFRLVAARGGRLDAPAHIPFGSFIAPAILVFWLQKLWGIVSFW